MADDDWINSDEPALLDSIIRHEGDKAAIYRHIRSGRIDASAACDGAACMDSGTWPAYVDSEGLDTVGIGHFITGDEPYDAYAGLTDQFVMNQLALDVEVHLAAAKRLANQSAMRIGNNYVVQCFMTELCFNIGEAGYRNFRNGLQKLASAVNGDGEFNYNDAADEHLDSRWAEQVGGRAVEMTDALRALDV